MAWDIRMRWLRTGVATDEHLNGAEVCVARRAGRKMDCMGNDAFPH